MKGVMQQPFGANTAPHSTHSGIRPISTSLNAFGSPTPATNAHQLGFHNYTNTPSNPDNRPKTSRIENQVRPQSVHHPQSSTSKQHGGIVTTTSDKSKGVDDNHNLYVNPVQVSFSGAGTTVMSVNQKGVLTIKVQGQKPSKEANDATKAGKAGAAGGAAGATSKPQKSDQKEKKDEEKSEAQKNENQQDKEKGFCGGIVEKIKESPWWVKAVAAPAMVGGVAAGGYSHLRAKPKPGPCKPGAFISNGACVSCPQGSGWNGKICTSNITKQTIMVKKVRVDPVDGQNPQGEDLDTFMRPTKEVTRARCNERSIPVYTDLDKEQGIIGAIKNNKQDKGTLPQVVISKPITLKPNLAVDVQKHVQPKSDVVFSTLVSVPATVIKKSLPATYKFKESQPYEGYGNTGKYGKGFKIVPRPPPPVHIITKIYLRDEEVNPIVSQPISKHLKRLS